MTVFEPAKTLHNARKNPSFLAKPFKILANFAKLLQKHSQKFASFSIYHPCFLQVCLQVCLKKICKFFAKLQKLLDRGRFR